METTAILFSFIAGILSTLSPCVLPLLPIIVSSSLQESFKGLFMLVLGLSMSFAITGTLLAYSAILWGFDIEIIKYISATLLIIFGLILLSEKLNDKFVSMASFLTQKSNDKLATYNATGNAGQFFLGILLGVAWTPCIGPSLGSAISLVLQGNNLLDAFIAMSLFGLGAGIPLLVIAFLSGKVINKKKVATRASVIKKIMAFLIILIGIGILTGLDKNVEIFLLSITPDWLLNLTTSI
jgi:cytochrome c-type biogenesis protein